MVLDEKAESFKDLKAKWLEQASDVTLKTLPSFLKHLTEYYTHDYGTICHAMSVAAIATLQAINKSPQGGITNFQASAIMWGFIREWQYDDNKAGLKIIDYDKMLYPQYEDNFQKTISKETWGDLQIEANRLLVGGHLSDKVHDHCKSIVAGKIPFGYTVSTEEY